MLYPSLPDASIAGYARCHKLDFRDVHRDTVVAELRKAGYSDCIKANWSTDKLIPWMQRIGRSLPCYFKCTTEDLVTFCTDRHIPLVLKDSGEWIDEVRMRIVMIDKLLAADETPQFFYLLRLPKELRNMIYELASTANYSETLKLPSQPPLALTSKCVRHEILPLFYRAHTFDIDFKAYDTVERSTTNYRRGREMHTNFRPTAETFCFLASIPPRSQDRIQKLKLSFEGLQSWFVTDYTIYVKIDFTQIGNEVTVSGKYPDYDGDLQADERKAVRAKVKVAMEGAVAGMEGGQAHQPGKVFKLTDLYAMRMAFQDLYNKSIAKVTIR